MMIRHHVVVKLMVSWSLILSLTPVIASTITQNDEIAHAISLLKSLGVPPDNLCTIKALTAAVGAAASVADLPQCPTTSTSDLGEEESSWFLSRRHRLLRYLLQEDDDDGDLGDEHDDWFYITHGLCALACVCTAALAAGLTMGLLSLDPLLLLIKMRAGATQKEQDEAASLLPLVKQHHLLLVTLLLLNSIANEALPLFLEVLVSPVVAVILSVTLVLFFGEIIPSAVFTGPNKIEIAAKMAPLVRVVMMLLWPLAFPIAKLLDHVLHDENSESSADVFTRGELSALIRIQYEERVAMKQQRKQEKTAFRNSVPPVTGLDFSVVPSTRSTQIDSAVRATKREVERRIATQALTPGQPCSRTSTMSPTQHDGDDSDSDISRLQPRRAVSIHLDEVSMVEGALQMKTKMAMDVFTPLHRIFAVPKDMVLNERNVVAIYSSGFSRIPVFEKNPKRPKDHSAICGILMTKQLIVVNHSENRPLATLPLYTPLCVSPKINLVDLLNLFQTGRVGHMALVCARPLVADDSLHSGQTLPEAAGFMGVITLEDVLEALLQEQIYDESDKIEREAERIAKWVTLKWKKYVQRRKRQQSLQVPHSEQYSMGQVVNAAMHKNEEDHDHNGAGEGTLLLPGGREKNQEKKGLFGLW